MSSIKKSFLNGVIWTSIEKLGQITLQFIVGIILARLISPEEFGLMGIIAIFISISQALINSGFQEALVRDQNIKKETYPSVLIFNFLISIIIYMILFFLAPYISKFYEEPRLTLIIRVISIIFIIGSLSIVQFANFHRKLKFKAISFNIVFSTAISGAIAIYFAYQGLGVWALVLQRIIFVTLSTIIFWIISDWKFQFLFDFKEIKRLFPFSSKLLASSLIENIYINISSLLIGKYFSLKEVGFYNQGKRLQGLPIITLSAILSSVMYPTFSKLKSDIELKSAFRKVIKLSVFIIFPISFLLILLAKPLVILLLTEKWEGVIIYLQILAFGGMLYPLHSFNLQVYKVKGRSDIFLKLEIIKKVIGFLLMFIAIPYGVIYLVLFEALSSYLLYPINAYYNGKLIQYKISEQVKEIIPTFLIAFIPALMLYLSNIAFSSFYIEILVVVTIYCLLYIFFTVLFNRSIINILKNTLLLIIKKVR